MAELNEMIIDTLVAYLKESGQEIIVEDGKITDVVTKM